MTASCFNRRSFNYCTDRCTLTASHSEITRGYINYCLCFEKAVQRNERMSLRIQNGEHVRSHFRVQSARSITLHPTWGSCAAIGRRSNTPLENPIGQSTTLSRQSGPRVSAQSVCGTVSGGGTASPSQSALLFRKGGKKETGSSPKDTSWTRLEIRVLPLDLISTSSEVVCGQQLIPVEGFPPSERTERRALPRRVWASERLSGGTEEKCVCVRVCSTAKTTDIPAATVLRRRRTLRIYSSVFFVFGYYISTWAEASEGAAADKGKKSRSEGGWRRWRWRCGSLAAAAPCFVIPDHQNQPCVCSVCPESKRLDSGRKHSGPAPAGASKSTNFSRFRLRTRRLFAASLVSFVARIERFRCWTAVMLQRDHRARSVLSLRRE